MVILFGHAHYYAHYIAHFHDCYHEFNCNKTSHPSIPIPSSHRLKYQILCLFLFCTQFALIIIKGPTGQCFFEIF